jgi:hypothetical protein
MAQTELNAVNRLLAAIGDSPQNSLDLGNPDVSIAVDLLDSISVDVQSEGWWFNTEVYDMSLDTDGKQVLPANTIFVDTYNSDWIRRGSYLYDKKNHTYDLTTALLKVHIVPTYKVIVKLDYDELPTIVYNFIINLAKVQYLLEMEGEAEKSKAAEFMAQRQYVQIKRMHTKFSDVSAFNSYTARKLLYNIQSWRY